MALLGTDKGNKRHPTKGTRQIPSGYGRAPATVQVRRRWGGRGWGAGEGKPTGEAGKQYEKEEIAGENRMLAPPRRAFICFW